MSRDSRGLSQKHREGMLSAITFGFLLILIGTIFVLNPELPGKIIDFARPESFELRTVAAGLNVSLPIPKNPRVHLLIYRTVEQFCLVWAVFLVAMLAVRFVFRSPTRNKAESIGNIAFWFGAAYFAQALLVDTTKWFEFWATVVALIGISLIVRAVFLIAAWKIHKD